MPQKRWGRFHVNVACTALARFNNIFTRPKHKDNANHISFHSRRTSCFTSTMTFERPQTSQSDDGPTPSCSRTPSPSLSSHDEMPSSHGLPTYAPPSILPCDYNVPSCIDHTSQFFEILASPYHPQAPLEPWVRSTPRQEDVERCAAMVDWGKADDDPALCRAAVLQEGSSTSRPAVDGNLVPDLPIYVPHGPWAWTAGEDIQQIETLLSLRRTCTVGSSFLPLTILYRGLDVLSLHTNWCHRWTESHFHQSTVRGFLMYALSSTNICIRRWNLDKQAEWIGFQSEVCVHLHGYFIHILNVYFPAGSLQV